MRDPIVSQPSVVIHEQWLQRARAHWSTAAFVTVALSVIVVWMPLQTPVALLAFQYARLPVSLVQGILLAKDVAVAGLILLLLPRVRDIKFHWLDWAAIGYGLVLVLYAVVSLLLGSRLAPFTVLAAVREYSMPLELYALGRLAMLAGADRHVVIRAFLGAAAIAALFTVVSYAVLPASFWTTSFDLVTFVRVVQGIPTAQTLWDISLLGQYGVGATAEFLRAVGPFTHPVGTAHYFVLPLAMCAALAFWGFERGSRLTAVFATLGVLLFAFAVITPISRGSWLGAVIAIGILSLVHHRVRVALAGFALVGLFLISVAPYSYSITSALRLSDSSAIAHQQALDKGAQVVTQNPLGLGPGQADQLYGQAASGGGAGGASEGDTSAGVGESMYLSLLVTVGPVGTLAFALWIVGLLGRLVPRRRIRFGSFPQVMAAAIGATLVGYLFSSLTASPLMRFTTSASFWLLAGLFLQETSEWGDAVTAIGGWFSHRRHGARLEARI